MAKTLNQFLEGYLKVKNPDEQKFVDKHVVAKHADRNGNDDEVFKGSKVKPIDRRKDRKGYNPGEDEKVYEELKGDQHQLDHNKNGKLDAHDFKLMRKKKKVAEEAEELEELSNDTLRRYRMKAKSIADHGGDQRTKGRELAGRKSYGGRMAGIEKAKVMAKEEAEQIDELSSDTLKSYRTKARAQGNKIVDKMKMGGGDWSKDHKDTQTLRKRSKGANMSGKQLVKRGESLKTEEAEQIDETAKIVAHLQKRYGDNIRKSHVMSAAKDFGVDSSKLAKAVRTKLGKNMLGEKLDMDKASMGDVITDFKDSNAPQFKGKSQDKRRAMAIAAKLTAERGGKPLRKEEKLADLLGDLTETHRRTMLSVFDKLNEDNQKKFLEACETPDGVESMLDFSISHRGE
jgi:hypothetical protein